MPARDLRSDMAVAIGLVAARAIAGRFGRSRAQCDGLCDGGLLRVAADANPQFLRVQFDFQSPRERCTQTQVEIIPEHGRIAVVLGQRARQHPRMAMPFDHLEAGTHGTVVDRIRDLAQAAADRRNHAAFAQFAADHESVGRAGATQPLPETEDRAGRNLQRMHPLPRPAQVMDLAHH